MNYLSSMSPAVSHNSSRTGTRTEYDDLDLWQTWTTDARWIEIFRRIGDRFRDVDCRVGDDDIAWFTVTDARGFASDSFGVITKRRPGRPVARPSCYSPLSVYLALSPSFHPSTLTLSFALSPFLSLKYRRIPTDTDASAVNRYLALPEAISVTKLPCLPIFMWDFN